MWYQLLTPVLLQLSTQHTQEIMSSESAKPDQASTGEGEKQKHFDREVREMVSAITHRFTDPHKSGSTHQQQVDEDDHGVRIVTLAGTNTGATLRSEQGEKSPPQGVSLDEPEALSTYVNSNFQAINNSIMLGGSYSTNDPGVHLDISDYFDNKGNKHERYHGKKLKKKEKENVKSDHHTEHSDWERMNNKNAKTEGPESLNKN